MSSGEEEGETRPAQDAGQLDRFLPQHLLTQYLIQTGYSPMSRLRQQTLNYDTENRQNQLEGRADKNVPSHSNSKRMGSEFLGKRMGSEFLGKRMGSEFLGKRMGSEFLGRRKRSDLVTGN